MANGTVKFNVGGRHFEVSRALVDEYSDTVLGKLVSGTWNNDPEKSVFIDRDGDIFAHILNYLRYGSIELPITIPRSMFDRELDYYGITSVEGDISEQESLHKVMDELKRNFHVAKLKHDLFFLAHECHYKLYANIHLNSTTNITSIRITIEKDHVFYASLLKAKNGKHERKLFDKLLERHFGLRVESGGLRQSGGPFDNGPVHFTVQKKEQK